MCIGDYYAENEKSTYLELTELRTKRVQLFEEFLEICIKIRELEKTI